MAFLPVVFVHLTFPLKKPSMDGNMTVCVIFIDSITALIKVSQLGIEVKQRHFGILC